MAQVRKSTLTRLLADSSISDAEKVGIQAEAASTAAKNKGRIERYWRKRIRAEIEPEIEKLKHELAEEKRYLEMAEDECSTLRAALALAEKVTP